MADFLQQRVEKIVSLLENKKAESVLWFDLRESGYFVDAVVLATAFVDKHALALLDELKTHLKPLGEEFLSIDEGSDWIVVDLGDILVHLFTENHRKKFNLEEFLGAFVKQRTG